MTWWPLRLANDRNLSSCRRRQLVVARKCEKVAIPLSVHDFDCSVNHLRVAGERTRRGIGEEERALKGRAEVAEGSPWRLREGLGIFEGREKEGLGWLAAVLQTTRFIKILLAILHRAGCQRS
jgi:hypothetical protein